MITEKQRKFIKDLARERSVPIEWRGMVDAVAYGGRQIQSGAARSLIAILMSSPRR